MRAPILKHRLDCILAGDLHNGNGNVCQKSWRTIKSGFVSVIIFYWLWANGVEWKCWLGDNSCWCWWQWHPANPLTNWLVILYDEMGRCLRAEGGDISFPSVQRRIFVLQSFEAIGLLWCKSSSAPLCLPCYAMHSNNIGKCSAPHWGRNVANKLHSCMESNVVCSLTIPIEIWIEIANGKWVNSQSLFTTTIYLSSSTAEEEE